MKKNEMVAGNRYWIAPLNDWKATGAGEEAEYTGRSDGLRAIFQFASSGPDDDGLDARPFVHVRGTIEDVTPILAGAWETNRVTDEKRVTYRKRARALGLANIIGISTHNVTLSHEDFETLTVLARKGMKS